MRAGRERPDVPWTRFDRVLHAFAPRRALERYRARVAVETLRRNYEGAAKDRRTEDWRSTSASADALIGTQGRLLRDRMRDLTRNNALAANALQVLCNNVVGYGIRPRAVSRAKARDKKVMELWRDWASRPDWDGHTTFEGLLALGVRQMLEGGEVFAVRRVDRKRRVPLAIQLLEADHLDDAKVNASLGSGRIEYGIEYDASGRRAAYWMLPDHPGDSVPGRWRSLESVRIPAAQVAHLFERQRLQSRGVPWGTPALRALRELGEWQDAELIRKRTEASTVAFVFGDLDDTQRSMAPKVKDVHGQELEQFEPGLIAYVDGGKDIKFNQPSATPGIREWNLVQMHIIAAGFRVPYALLTGDLSQTNFSSSRVGLNEFRRMVEQLQWQTVIPMLCEPIWRWFCESAFTAGLIDRPDIPVEWDPPRFESVNPLQDAQADLLEVRAGFASLQQMVGKRGYDLDEVVEDQRKALELTDQAGLILDSDPRNTSRAGQRGSGSGSGTGDGSGEGSEGSGDGSGNAGEGDDEGPERRGGGGD